MGIGLVIFFWTVVGAVLLAVYFGLASLSRTSPRAQVLKKALVAAVAAILIPVVTLVAFDFARGFFPGSVFQLSFGFSPPPDVTELKGRRTIFGDAGDIYLRFKADKTTVERIISARFQEHAGSLLPDALTGTPDYWKPVRTASTRYFRADHFDDSFASSQAILIYDEATGVVHFHWSGVD
ncbi:MAG TPA: hypothetical protein VGW12_12620 [Pyrinomonadaceae bacterium]|nr:hypothetical protein [Pyrinomonadaceae bacterium]